MRKRLIIGLSISSIMIISSVIMSLYTYHYSTTNRVGVVGNWDGEFHFKSIISYIFTFLSGTMLFISSLIQLLREGKRIDKMGISFGFIGVYFRGYGGNT